MKQALLIIGALLVAGGGYYWYGTMQPAATVPATTNTTANTDTTTTTGVGVGVDVGASVSTAPMSATVTYTTDGFAPKAVTIKKGGTVTWLNQGGGNMWVGAASHPTHTSYSGTTLAEHCGGTAPDSFDQCENGETYSFTFDKVGTWYYHNHSRASHFGSVVVVE